MASSRSTAARPRAGRREHRKLTTRRDLMSAGRSLFGEMGLYESRIEDVANHANIAKGTLYRYFASKAALIEAVVASGLGELLGYVHRRAQGARTHAEVVTRVVEAHLEFFVENPDLMRIFHQVRGLLKFNHPEGKRLRRVLANYLASLAHVLALHRPTGQEGRQGPIALATLLFGAVSGVTSMRASVAGPMAIHDRSRATVRALVAMVSSFERSAGGRGESVAGLSGHAAAALRSTVRRPVRRLRRRA